MSNKIWSLVGKVAVLPGLIATIWAMIQIYDYFFPEGYEIVAYCEYSSFGLPDFYAKKLDEFKDLMWWSGSDNIQKELNEFVCIEKDTIKREVNSFIESDLNTIKEELNKPSNKRVTVQDFLSTLEGRNYGAASKIRDYINNNYPRDLIDEMGSLDSIFLFTIKNEGDREVHDLKLELPVDGFYQIERSGEDIVSSKFSKNIVLGSLRPQNEIKVTVWSRGYFSEDETRITYPDGVIQIDYSTQARGFPAFLAKHWNLSDLSLTGMLVVMFVLLIVLVIKVIIYT